MLVLNLLNARFQERIDTIQIPARPYGFWLPRRISCCVAQLQTLAVCFENRRSVTGTVAIPAVRRGEEKLSLDSRRARETKEPRMLARGSAARLFRRRQDFDCWSELTASIFECLSAIHDDGFDFPFTVVDFNLEGAEERRLLSFDLFDASLQQRSNPCVAQRGLMSFTHLQRMLGRHARRVLANNGGKCGRN
jgi:hypothetical protein